MDGLKQLRASLGKGYLRQTEDPIKKHRGMKANDTVWEPRTVPHSKTKVKGHKQGELNWDHIIRGLVYFPKSLVFIFSSFFSHSFERHSRKAEKHNKKISLFSDKGTKVVQ